MDTYSNVNLESGSMSAAKKWNKSAARTIELEEPDTPIISNITSPLYKPIVFKDIDPKIQLNHNSMQTKDNETSSLSLDPKSKNSPVPTGPSRITYKPCDIVEFDSQIKNQPKSILY